MSHRELCVRNITLGRRAHEKITKWMPGSLRPKDVEVPLKRISMQTARLTGLAYLRSTDIKWDCKWFQ